MSDFSIVEQCFLKASIVRSVKYRIDPALASIELSRLISSIKDQNLGTARCLTPRMIQTLGCGRFPPKEGRKVGRCAKPD